MIDFIEPFFGRLAKHREPGIPFLLLSFEQTQSLADDFAGVAIAPRGDLVATKWSRWSVRLMLRVGMIVSFVAIRSRWARLAN